MIEVLIEWKLLPIASRIENIIDDNFKFRNKINEEEEISRLEAKLYVQANECNEKEEEIQFKTILGKNIYR